MLLGMVQAKMHRMEEEAREHADMGDQMDAINYEKLQIENQELHRNHQQGSKQLLRDKHAAFMLLQAGTPDDADADGIPSTCYAEEHVSRRVGTG